MTYRSNPLRALTLLVALFMTLPLVTFGQEDPKTYWSYHQVDEASGLHYCLEGKTALGLYEVKNKRKKLILQKSMLSYLVVNDQVFYVDPLENVHLYNRKTKKDLILNPPIHKAVTGSKASKRMPFEPFVMAYSDNRLLVLQQDPKTQTLEFFTSFILNKTLTDGKVVYFKTQDAKWQPDENALLYIEEDGAALYRLKVSNGTPTVLIATGAEPLQNNLYHQPFRFMNGSYDEAYSCFEHGYLTQDHQNLMLTDYRTNTVLPVADYLKAAYPSESFADHPLTYLKTEAFSGAALTFMDMKTKKTYALTSQLTAVYAPSELKAIQRFEKKWHHKPYRVVKTPHALYFYDQFVNEPMPRLVQQEAL